MPLAPGEPSPVAKDGMPNDFIKTTEPMATEDEDPLHNDSVLLRGLRIAEPGDDATNTIRKVPSDQIFSTFRWGYVHLTSERVLVNYF